MFVHPHILLSTILDSLIVVGTLVLPSSLYIILKVWASHNANLVKVLSKLSCVYVPLHVCHLGRFLVEGLTMIQFDAIIVYSSNLLFVIIATSRIGSTCYIWTRFFSSFLLNKFSSLTSKKLEVWSKSMVAYKRMCTQILKIEEEFFGGKV